MKKSITCLLTGITLMGIQISPLGISPSIALENETTLIAQSSSQIEVTNIKGFKGVISIVGVSPDGNTLIVGSNDGKITAINIEDSETIYSIPVKANPYSKIALTSDGELFAVSEKNSVFVDETETGERIKALRAHTGNIGSLTISPDDRTLVSVSGQDLTLKIWDLDSGDLLEDIGDDVDSISTIAFHPNGNFFATGAGGIGSDKTIKYWDAENYDLLKTLPKQFGFIYDLTFDSQGDKMIGAVSNYVKIWDLKRNNREIMSLKASPLELNKVAISPDNRLIATANREGKIKIIDVRRKRIIATLTGHQGWVQTITFSPDSKTLYSGAEDKLVQVWDLSGF